MRVLVVAVAFFIAACGPSLTPSPSGAAEPVIAFDEQGQFRLELELPKATYAAGEPIEGIARLRYAGPGAVEIGGGGGLIVFSLNEVDGPRDVGGGQDLVCNTFALDPVNPFTTVLTKSGGFSQDDPNRVFIESFLKDPEYRLPAGTWDIQASTQFLGKGCELPATDLSAAVRIVVTD